MTVCDPVSTPDDALDAAEDLRANGLHDEALALIAPHLPQGGRRLHCLYADLLLEQGRTGETIRHLETALRLFADSPALWLRLGRAFSSAQRSEEAIDALQEAAALDGGSRDIVLALGMARQQADDLPRAIADYERLLRRNPEDVEAHFRLGECWAALDETDRAARAFNRVLVLDPADHLGAAIRLAEMNSRAAPLRASRSYVRHLFDGYAPRYDTHMRQALSYRGPEAMLELALPHWPASPRFAAIADLGCGSGLSGAAFRPFTDYLVGIDLSPRMTGLAEATGHYDTVATGDILDWLAANPRTYDVAVACDVVIYFGDLDPLFAAVGDRLAPEGWFLFSTEKGEDDLANGFEIGPSRRFRHSAPYLDRIATQHGFDIRERRETVLRYERRAPVISYLTIARLTRRD